MGYPNSWMVYEGKSHIEMADGQRYPYFRKSPLWECAIADFMVLQVLNNNVRPLHVSQCRSCCGGSNECELRTIGPPLHSYLGIKGHMHAI